LQREKDAKKFVMPASGVVELGKKTIESTADTNTNAKKKKSDELSIDKITDLELLHKMMRLTNSRGKK
jgi:hypothetical protein